MRSIATVRWPFRHCHRRAAAALVLVLTWWLPTVLAAQGQEAVILGRVTDASGGVLPGVTVTASSPALQVGQIIDVTDERGNYRLANLPIGTYAVVYELPGFRTVRREGLRLTAGFTAQIDEVMAIGGLEESITVTGVGPVVDTRSTAPRTQLTRETLEIIPTSRSGLVAVMSQAPGTRPQLDWAQTTNPVYRSFGQSGQAWTTLEGVAMQSPKADSGGGGNFADYASFEETVVQTLGHSAEAITRGIQMNMIVKSGGNDFHGGGYASITGHRLESNNLDEELRARGITGGNPVDTRSDLSGELGGRIVRDKLWFYGSWRRRVQDARVLNAFQSDGSQAKTRTWDYYATTKLSYQMNPSNKFIGFFTRNWNGGLEGASQFIDWESRRTFLRRTRTFKGEWQATLDNKFLSVQSGAHIWNVPSFCYSDGPITADQLTQRVTGCHDAYGIDSFEDRYHTKASLGWYKPNWFLGDHDFKMGFDSSKGHADRRVSDRGPNPAGPTGFPTQNVGNFRLIFRNGVPFQFEGWNNCFTGGDECDPRTLYWYRGGFVQDSWTLARGVTLNVGIRVASDRGWVPEQCRTASAAPLDVVFPAECFDRVDYRTFNSVAPRVHVAWDLAGNGRTVLKGGWGRFPDLRGTEAMVAANENSHLRSTYRWRDLNGNKLFDPGEVNFDPNGPDFVSTSHFTAATLAGQVPNPKEKQPRNDEVTLSVEHQLMEDFGVRATGIYSRASNNWRMQNNLRPFETYSVPVTNPDPGPDGRVGTADDPGTLVTYFEYPVALRGREFQQPMLVTDPTADETYKSVELAANKRMSNRWQAMVSYSATRIHVPFVRSANDFATGGSIAIAAAELNPNAEFNTQLDTWEWTGRATGAYIFPGDVQVSANYEHRSGFPYARHVSFRGGQTIPSIRLRVEPIGARRLSTINLLHLRAEKSLRFANGQSVGLKVNVFNATNINTVQTVNNLSGPRFLEPTSIIPPRIVEFAVDYKF